MIDRTRMKLGRLPAVFDPRVPRLEQFGLPDGRDVDWGRDIPPRAWGAMNNDNIGDCTAAATGHADMAWGSYTGGEAIMTPAEATALYSATSGYVPGDEATDNGTTCQAVLKYWLANGIVAGGRTEQLLAFANCRLDWDTLRQTVWFFGGAYVGVVLRAAQLQKGIWNESNTPVIGGHCTWVTSIYADTGMLVTWGEEQQFTRAWWEQSAEESYGLLGKRWLENGVNPAGIPKDEMIQAMANLGAPAP